MESLLFLEDIYPKNVLYAATIRSPVARGRLIKIETPSELPDDFKLVTAKDIPGGKLLYDTNIPILADDKLCYIGEPVAILLGQDKTKLEDLAARCLVIAEEEKPVFSCRTYEKLLCKREITAGDTQEAFENTGRIVTGSYTTGIQEHWYAEPVGSITLWKSSGKKTEISKENKSKKTTASEEKILIVKTATQWPNHVKQSVSLMLGLDASSVSVEPTTLNLHMDGKLWYPSLVSCHAALGTFLTKRPVRLILTKKEDFLYTPKRASVHTDIASTIDEKGNITGSEIDISVNLGAYGVNGKEILDQVCLGSLGFYKFQNLKLTAKANVTNIPPQGPFSGFGLAQGLFAIERHLSQIADITAMDPAELRKTYIDPRILIPSSQASKNSIVSGNELLDTVTKMSDYYRKWSSYELLRQTRKGKAMEKGEQLRGIGIAAGYQGNGLLYYGKDEGTYSVEVTLTIDSILEIKTEIASIEEYSKILQKIAANALSITPEMVQVVSDSAADCGPSCASRNITVIARLVERCCYAIQKQRFREPLPITVHRSIKPQSGVLRNDINVMDINGFIKPALAAAVVEVSINMIECIPKIRGVWLAVDGGKIISPHRAKRGLTRSATQALGWAFTENIEYIDGKIPAEQYNNFEIFSPVNNPVIEIDFLPTDASEPKGIGELPFTCIPAAFLQAVSQAIDFCFKSIPLKRNDIWEMSRIKNDDYQAVK